MKFHKNYLRFLLAAIGLVFGFVSANAQTVAPLPDVLTLEIANERFLERNLQIEAARLQISRAEAERVAARLRPRPVINVSAENLRVAGETPFNRLYEIGAVVTQPFELGGQRGARRELAERTVSLAEAQLTNVIRQRQFELRRAFYEVLLAQTQLALETQNRTNFAELLRYSEVRLQEGDVSPGEVIKVRLEKVKYDSAVANTRLSVRQAKIRLLELLGETDFSGIEQLETRERFEFVDFRVDLPQLKQTALENRPEIEVARAEINRAVAAFRLERARRKGEIVPYTGYKKVGVDNTVLVGVSVPLPFGNRNQGEIARAKAEQRIAENVLLQTRNRTLAEVETAFLAYETAKELVKIYEMSVVEQADESLNIMLLSYREGATDLVNLLDAQRTRNEVRSNYYRSVSAYYLSLFQLELVTGTEIRK
ncbi:MAG TPA: TolC family protein [Pyrinomonadaceae bacterium]|nr:TolC family protein [Pyrinomonadaceae bacterium]